MKSRYIDQIEGLSKEDKIKFYEIFAHELTISVRGVWNDPDLSDKEKIQHMKCINEIMHQIVSKTSNLRLGNNSWDEEQSLSHIENWARQANGLPGNIGWAFKHSFEVLGKLQKKKAK